MEGSSFVRQLPVDADCVLVAKCCPTKSFLQELALVLWTRPCPRGHVDPNSLHSTHKAPVGHKTDVCVRAVEF